MRLMVLWKKMVYIFFYRKLDFPSEPGVANEILENEAKSCLVLKLIFTLFSENQLGSCLAVA